MNQHPFGHHLSTCSSPDNCAEYAAIAKMTSAEYFKYLTERNHVDAASQVDQRTAIAAERSYAPPDAYGPQLAALRAAHAADLSRSKDPLLGYEGAWKEKRFREIDAEAAARDAEGNTWRPMTAAEEADLAKYAPPDPYAAGLKSLREKEGR